MRWRRGFPRAHAEFGVETVEGTVSAERAIGRDHPSGGLVISAQDLAGEGDDTRHAHGAIGLVVGEALAGCHAAAEGASRNVETFCDLRTVHGELFSQHGDSGGGQTGAHLLDQIAGVHDGVREDARTAEDVDNLRHGHIGHLAQLYRHLAQDTK